MWENQFWWTVSLSTNICCPFLGTESLPHLLDIRLWSMQHDWRWRVSLLIEASRTSAWRLTSSFFDYPWINHILGRGCLLGLGPGVNRNQSCGPSLQWIDRVSKSQGSKSLSLWPKSTQGFCELSSQLGSDFWPLVFVSALSHLSKNPPSSASDHFLYPVRLLSCIISQVTCAHPGLPSVRIPSGQFIKELLYPLVMFHPLTPTLLFGCKFLAFHCIQSWAQSLSLENPIAVVSIRIAFVLNEVCLTILTGVGIIFFFNRCRELACLG